MLSFTVSGSLFKSSNSALNGNSTPSFTWAQIVWAAISVGKAESAHVLRYGLHSGFELLRRIGIVFANWREDASGRVCKTSAFKALNPSEKGAMSYFFGLTVAKLLASARLGVPWLMHLDVYRHRVS